MPPSTDSVLIVTHADLRAWPALPEFARAAPERGVRVTISHAGAPSALLALAGVFTRDRMAEEYLAPYDDLRRQPLAA